MILPPRRVILSATRNIWCLVDAEDYDWVMQWQWNWGWHKWTPWKFYAKRNIGAERSTIYLHRELMLHFEPVTDLTLVVDHENGQSLDNRRSENLRWVTASQNRRNRTPRALVPKLGAIEKRCKAAAPVFEEVPF